MAFFQFSGVRGFSSTFPIVARQTHARDFDFDRADPRDTVDRRTRAATPPPKVSTTVPAMGSSDDGKTRAEGGMWAALARGESLEEPVRKRNVGRAGEKSEAVGERVRKRDVGHAGEKSERKRDVARALERIVVKGLEKAFAFLGGLQARTPWIVFIGVFLALLVGSGMFAMLLEKRKELDVNKLWTPAKSRAWDDKAAVTGTYGDYPRVAAAVVVAKPTVLNGYVLGKVLEFDAQVANITVVGTDGSSQTYTDICEKVYNSSTAPCVKYSITDFWDRNQALLTAAVNVDALALNASRSTIRTSEGLIVSRNNVMGQIKFEVNSTDDVELVRAGMTSYALSSSKSKDKVVQDWEKKFIELAKVFERSEGNFEFSYISSSSIEDEMTRGASKVLPLAAVGAFLITVLLFRAMSKNDALSSRAWLAPTVVCLICLSCAAGLGGSMMLFHSKYTTLTPVILFLVLGIGVDDTVLILGISDRASRATEPVERQRSIMKHAAAFVTVTSATTVIAFLTGVGSKFPGVSYFCLSASMVMLANYVAICVGFGSLLVLDDRRRENLIIPLQCFRRVKMQEDVLRNKQLRDKLSSFVSLTTSTHDMFTKLYKSRAYKLTILLTFYAAIPAFCAYMVSTMQTGLETAVVLPDDSYVTKYLKTHEATFPELGPRIDLHFGSDFDFESPSVRAQISTLAIQLQNLDSVGPYIKSVFDGYDAYRATVNSSATLSSFMSNPRGVGYLQDVTIGTDALVTSARITLWHKVILGSNEKMKAMRDVRAIVDNSPIGKKTVVFSPDYVFWESYPIQVSELLSSLGYSLLVVLVVLSCFMHLYVSTLIAATVLLMDVVILGYMVMSGMKLHSVTTICIILAIGVSVDFSAHMAHAWLHATGSRYNKSVTASAELAVGLTTGAASTFLGVLPLAYAPVEATRIFFHMMAGILIVGWGYGAIALPVLLLYVGPSDKLALEDEKNIEDAYAELTTVTRPAFHDKPLPTPDPIYGIENLSFEGGGYKIMSYAGAVMALEKKGVLPYVKRLAGASGGSLVAALLCLGCDSKQILQEFEYDLSYFLFEHHDAAPVPGLLPALLGFMSRGGANRPDLALEFLRLVMYRYTGNSRLTFAELYALTGRELCVVATNLTSQGCTYFHVKTTAHVEVATAVLASCSIPLLVTPIEIGGELFTDGGVTNNYPVSVFDGWWLSLEPEDSFLSKLADQVERKSSLQATLSQRFGGRDDCNLRTLGFKTFGDDDMADIAATWVAPGGEEGELPDTLLATSRRAVRTEQQVASEKAMRVIDAFSRLLASCKKYDDGSQTMDVEEWRNVIHDTPRADLEVLFSGRTDADEIFKIIDIDGSGELDFYEISRVLEDLGFTLDMLLGGIVSKNEITSGQDVAGATFETLCSAIAIEQMKTYDFKRTVAIPAGYIGVTDGGAAQPADREWIISNGERATLAYLYKRKRSSLNSILTRRFRHLRKTSVDNPKASSNKLVQALNRGTERYRKNNQHILGSLQRVKTELETMRSSLPPGTNMIEEIDSVVNSVSSLERTTSGRGFAR